MPVQTETAGLLKFFCVKSGLVMKQLRKTCRINLALWWYCQICHWIK